MSLNLRSVCAVIAASLHQFVIFSLFLLANLSIYITSYLRQFYTDKNPIKVEHGYFLSPIGSLTMSSFCSLGGYFEHKLGPRLTILIGSIVIAIGSFLLTISPYLWVDYLIIPIYGLGFGIGSMASIKNAMVYFPGHQGAVNNIITACGNLGGALFNYLMTIIIHANERAPDDKDFVKSEDAARYKNYLYVHIAAVIGVTLISMGLMLKKKQNEEVTERTIQSIIPKEQGVIDTLTGEDMLTNVNTSFDIEEPTKPQEIKNDESNSLYKQNVKAAICSSRTFLLFVIFLLTSFETNTISITYFPFGIKNKIDTVILGKGATIGSIVSAFVGPCWGFLYDILGFRVIIIIVNIICGINGCVFYFFKEKHELLIISAVLNTCITGGAYGLLFPQIMKVFTHKYATEIYGVVVFSTGISGMLSAVYIFIIKYVVNFEDNMAYLTLYVIAAILNGIAIFVSLFENSEKYKYPNEKEESKEISA